MNPDPPPAAARPSPPQLRPARFDDYPQIQQIEAANLDETLSPSDWRGLFLDNPLWLRLGDRWPIGWVLEDAASRVVGSLTNVPSLYRFRGRELICASGRAWAVSGDYRGFALWLMDEYFNQPGADLFMNTTVGAQAMPALAALSSRVPLGDWETAAFWVTRYRGFARKALEKMGVPLAGALALPAAAALRLKDALFAKRLPAVPASVVVAAEDGFDSRFDRFWEELARNNPEKLLGVRDRPALSWHFAVSKRQGRLWINTASRGGLLRAYCILLRQDARQGVRRVRLIDYQTVDPDADLLPGLLGAALRRCAAEDAYLLEHLGCGLPKMHGFDRFAPYRRKLSNWPFYYHAADPALAAELSRPEVWDPSGFDGDAGLM
ncbi:MAG TPA: hypothetical protein VMS17_19620 [Gemmataceae bacterium]|nr:hypothetical protein [Gemmataceae bacterium]